MKIEKLELENICKNYEMNQKEIKALSNINYTFKPGKIYAIMGHSGSGKSTLINILGFIESNFFGSYKINDIDTKSMNEIELAKIRNQSIGFIF